MSMPLQVNSHPACLPPLCAGALALATLDVSACKSLMSLQCDSPCLTLAKARVCPTLRLVRLASLALQTLDVSHCTNLVLVELQLLQQLNQYVGGGTLQGAALAAAAHAAVVDVASQGVQRQPQQAQSVDGGGVGAAGPIVLGKGLGALQVRTYGSEQLHPDFMSQVQALRAARKSVQAAALAAQTVAQ